MDHRESIDRGWYYTHEPDDGVHAPDDVRVLRDPDGKPLTRRLHGTYGRIQVVNRTGGPLPSATLLRSAAAVGDHLTERPNARIHLRDRKSVV